MACIRESRLSFWPQGLMPYQIDSNDFPAGSDERDTILEAIDVWNDQTILRLRQWSGETNFVKFVAASTVCQSAVGMIGGSQQIGCAVGDGFGVWQVVHEIGHAFGMWHEHTRLDRDRWVTVNWSEIKTDEAHNFQSNPANRQDVCRYDYDSIMHYSKDAFSASGNDTLTPTMSGVDIGQRDHLSTLDIRAVLFVHGRFSLRTQMLRRFLPPALGIRLALPAGGSVRQWMACTS